MGKPRRRSPRNPGGMETGEDRKTQHCKNYTHHSTRNQEISTFTAKKIFHDIFSVMEGKPQPLAFLPDPGPGSALKSSMVDILAAGLFQGRRGPTFWAATAIRRLWGRGFDSA